MRIFAIFLAAVLCLSTVFAPAATAYPKNSKYGVIVPNELYVTIYDHKIAGAHNAPAWTLVTDGLKAVGQDELILTILHAPESTIDQIPRGATAFFNAVYSLAKQHKTVHAGGFTTFGDPTYLIAPQFKGVLYIDAAPPEGVLAPLGSLVVIPVTTEEMEAFNIGGPLRVTGRLSVQSSYFPFPTWCDPERKSVFAAAEIAEMKKEPILGVSRMPLAEANMFSSANLYEFIVPERAQSALIDIMKALPPSAPIALLLGIGKSADAAFTWSDKRPTATAAPNSKAERIAGSFVLISRGAVKPNFGQLGDGFAVLLTDAQWKQLEEAIYAKRSLTLTQNDGPKFVMLMQPPIPPDLMKKRSYSSTGGWLEYSHGQPPPASASKCPAATEAIKGVFDILLNDDSVIKQSIAVEDLSAYGKDVDKTVRSYFSNRKKGTKTYELIVHLHLEPKQKPGFKIYHRPAGIDDGTIKGLYQKLSELRPLTPPDPANPLDVEFVFSLWPCSTGKTATSPALPRATPSALPHK